MSSRRRQQSFVKETNSHFSQPHNELLGSPFHSHSDRSSNYSSSPNPNDVKLNHSPRLSLHSPRVSRFPLYREEQKVERLPSPTLDFVDTVTDINNNLSNENLSLEDKESQETQYSLFLSQPSSLSIPPIRNVDQASQLSSPSYISNSTNNSYKSSGQTYNGKIRTPPTTYPKTFSSPNSSERSISDESYHSIQESFKVTNERIVAVSPTQPPRMIETPLKAVEFSPADTIVPKATPELSPGFNLATIQVPKLRSAAQISHNQSPQLSSTVSITPKQVPQLSPAISYSPSLSVTPSSNTSITTPKFLQELHLRRVSKIDLEDSQYIFQIQIQMKLVQLQAMMIILLQLKHYLEEIPLHH
ncbi:hypothetical protein DFJ63DRAFT_312017 [Scheffersomyces coipomensis]|uniref:uncharacterized protein n=1 Tax=Scheffersomyces coipomensis TaxID=1788519 RepID=UPI00315CB341